ncbi:MAG: 50S ribosomal protein L9 [Bdellovibrionota bacterium]
MKVILNDDVVGLGDIGETVNVKPGYARNFLIPRGLAIETGSASARVAQHRIRQIESKKRKLRGVAEERAKALQSITLTMEVRVGDRGRVFGSLSSRDIAVKLAEHGYELDRRRVLLAEPIKKLGEHTVRVKLHQDVETEVKIIVQPRESTKEEAEQDVNTARQSIEEGAAEKQAANDAAESAEPSGDAE